MQHCAQAFKLHVDNLRNLLARQSMKDHDVVDAIKKLRLEMLVQNLGYGFASLTFVCSKVWLRMDRALSVPYVGDIEWRSLYVSSRGPWIDHTAYLVQLLAMVPVVLLFCYWWQSEREGKMGTTSPSHR